MLIGDVSHRAGISARMLRHYDSLGLVSPSGRTVGGYREYSPSDIRRLFHVESLRSLGLSLSDLRRALDDPEFTPAALVTELVAATQERISREEELLQRLRQVEKSEAADWNDVLRVVALMRGLGSEDPSKRQRIALSAADDPGQASRLLAEAVLAETDLNVAGALRWALRRTGDTALEILGPALNSADAGVRHRAMVTIAELESEDATALLAEALSHADPDVRGHAARTLGARGDPRAIPELVDLIITGARDVEAAEALGSIARERDLDDPIAEMLEEQLGRESVVPDSRLRLTQALAELTGPVALRVLDALAEDSDHRVAMTAVAIARHRPA